MRQIRIMTKEGSVPPKQGRPSVVISQNPTRTSVWVDQFGNEIDRRTKQIIKRNEDK